MRTLVGAGYRPTLHAIFDDGAAEVAELILDHYGDVTGYRRPWDLARVVGRVPLLLHGLSGNFASVIGPRDEYVALAVERARGLGVRAYSDHLAMTRTTTHGLGHLSPNLYDPTLLQHTAAHVERVARALAPIGCPLMLENLAYDVRLPGSAWTAEEFTLRLLGAEPHWSLLLDVTNLWVNATNFDFDARAFVDAVAPERIGLVHMAGPERFGTRWVDTHGAAVREEVFELLRYVLRRPGVDPLAIVVERDSNLVGAEAEVRADLARVKAIVRTASSRLPMGARAAASPSRTPSED